MRTVTALAWYKDNSMVVQLGTTDEPLTDELTDTTITDAVVQVISIADRGGTVLTGESFPVAMAHIGAGIYRGAVSYNLAVADGEEYTVEIRAEKSGSRATWRIPVLVEERAA